MLEKNEQDTLYDVYNTNDYKLFLETLESKSIDNRTSQDNEIHKNVFEVCNEILYMHIDNKLEIVDVFSDYLQDMSHERYDNRAELIDRFYEVYFLNHTIKTLARNERL